jgi:hypothetical protein
MKDLVSYLLAISFGLLVLILFEGIFTMGDAFKFENYGVIGWISQVLLIVCVICVAIKAVQAEK